MIFLFHFHIYFQTKLNAKASPLHVLPLYAMLSSRRQAMVRTDTTNSEIYWQGRLQGWLIHFRFSDLPRKAVGCVSSPRTLPRPPSPYRGSDTSSTRERSEEQLLGRHFFVLVNNNSHSYLSNTSKLLLLCEGSNNPVHQIVLADSSSDYYYYYYYYYYNILFFNKFH